MSALIESQEALFAAGYDRGREEGIRQTITILRILVEIYGHSNSYSDPAETLLPKKHAEEMNRMLESFADARFKEGAKYERDKAKRKAERENGA